MKEFDLVVIGSGPGGYPAAIAARQTGASVALIEAGDLGGTCLNRGCIPSKTIIASARLYHKMKESEKWGVKAEKVTFDYPSMVERSQDVVKKIRTGLSNLLKANEITTFKGFGKFISPFEVKVIGEDNVVIRAKKVIVASGSEPRVVPAFPCDGKTIHDSTSMLQLKKIPKKLVVIGGGVIGCEFASMMQLLGVEVVILEMLPRIISTECTALSNILTQSLKKRGVDIRTEAKVKDVSKKSSGVTITLQDDSTIDADMALVAVGRSVNADDIGLEAAGVPLNERGAIDVNEHMETSVKGIYAIGDVLGKWWLAHVATHQGIVAARHASGQAIAMHESAIPSVIFTDPEIASVGLDPEQAEEKGYLVEVGSFPFQALGKSQAIGEPLGFAQTVIDKNTGLILGAQIAGHEAATLIAEMALAVNNELTVECVTETIHAHPTLPEACLEASLLAQGTPLHFPPKKKKRASVS